MNSGVARSLFEKYASAICYVSVQKPNGDQAIGSAFHVGEGVFVTARHVVEGRRIVEIASTERRFIRLEDEEAKESRVQIVMGGEKFAAHEVNNGVMQLSKGPFFHSSESVDVAVFQVEGIDQRTPYFVLGDHLDDWLGISDFVLTEVIVMGYPPIPFTNAPRLFAARAEINALIDVRDTPNVHFILSAMPRGGFSGGVALTESEIVLGVITRSLLSADTNEELGYFTVLSVEPIYQCLSENKILPDCQAEGWDDLWNTEALCDFYDPEKPTADIAGVITAPLNVAHLSLFDDGKRVHLEIICNDSSIFEQSLKIAELSLRDFGLTRQTIREGMVKLKIDGSYDRVVEVAKHTAEIIRKTFLDLGLKQR